MRITKLIYVFSFIFILSLSLNNVGFAQKKSFFQKGLATWYGTHFHGKKTANDEVYNKHEMTAAHLTLPFGTKVKVTNQKTKKSIIVRINDRGPWGNKKRIIDLSEAAARKLKIYADGSAKVTVEIIPKRSWVAHRKKKKESKLLESSTEAKLAKAPAPVAPPAVFNPNLPYLNIQTEAFTLQANAWLAEINQPIDYRQPIALREEELKGYWLHRVEGGQFMNLAPTEEYKARLKLNGLTGVINYLPGAS